MGIDVNLWRARIGLNNPSTKSGMQTRMAGIVLSLTGARRCLHVLLLLTFLTVLAGDVELNPGPIDGTRQTKLVFKKPDRSIDCEQEIIDIWQTVEILSKKIEDLERDNKFLKEKVTHLEDQSRRDNLIFYGIPESVDGKETWEESENLVRNVMKDTLKVESADMEGNLGIEIERAHRLPRSHGRHGQQVTTENQPRPIIVKFSRWKHRQKILE